ncbi:MAG: nucleotidyl transferase AbiEii/AbiGii toxin family protein [Candidatus Micrarchaeia archaeon]
MVATIAFKIDELKNYAIKSGLNLNLIIKEAFLFELIESIRIEEFVLKGGTAINKGYLINHQRFSEDLDYDTDLSVDEVKTYIRSIDWDIKKEFFTKHSIGFVMSYQFENIKDVVKLDISFGIKNKIEKKRIVSDFIPASKIVSMYSFEELNYQKEVAFEERREWKDIYDLYWMHELYTPKFRITNKTKFKNALLNIDVPKIANAYIPVQNRPNWKEVIDKLKQATE